ncbi:MAG: hypothetical protein CVV25_03470, partial [Ignavibacteriae bacterium HGW-Ignavibacteriae-4]
MNFRILSLFLTIALVSCQSNNKLEDRVDELTRKIDSLEKVDKNDFKPGLGTLMNAIQVHHLKLWKSGIKENWELANFELHELEERFEDVGTYHINSSSIKSVKMIYPQLEELEKSVNMKSKSAFVKEYELLTATCNSCHQINDHP